MLTTSESEKGRGRGRVRVMCSMLARLQGKDAKTIVKKKRQRVAVSPEPQPFIKKKGCDFLITAVVDFFL